MPVYPYRCTSCSHEHDVAKSVRQIDDPEYCPKCQANSRRYLVAVNFNGASDWDKAEFNPGLGCVVKNSKHREQIAKQRGLIEVGNEDFEKTITSSEKKLEQDINERTEKTMEGVRYGLNKVLKGEKL